MIPPWVVESPIFLRAEFRSTVKTLPEPVAGAVGAVPPDAPGSPPLPHDTKLQPMHTANAPMPSFDRNSSLSIIFRGFKKLIKLKTYKVLKTS
jgi:hypothetical protein